MFFSGATGQGFLNGSVLFNLSGCVENHQDLLPFHTSTYLLHSNVHVLRESYAVFSSLFHCSEYTFVSEIPSSAELAKAAHFPYQGHSPGHTCPRSFFQVCLHL